MWAQEGAQADVGSTLPTVPPQRISRAVDHAAPWLILAGSGGIADVLAALMNQPHLLVPQVAEKQFKEKFPGEHFCWEDIVHWTELVGASQGLQGPKALLPALSPPPGWGWPWGTPLQVPLCPCPMQKVPAPPSPHKASQLALPQALGASPPGERARVALPRCTGQ